MSEVYWWLMDKEDAERTRDVSHLMLSYVGGGGPYVRVWNALNWDTGLTEYRSCRYVSENKTYEERRKAWVDHFKGARNAFAASNHSMASAQSLTHLIAQWVEERLNEDGLEVDPFRFDGFDPRLVWKSFYTNAYVLVGAMANRVFGVVELIKTPQLEGSSDGSELRETAVSLRLGWGQTHLYATIQQAREALEREAVSEGFVLDGGASLPPVADRDAGDGAGDRDEIAPGDEIQHGDSDGGSDVDGASRTIHASGGKAVDSGTPSGDEVGADARRRHVSYVPPTRPAVVGVVEFASSQKVSLRDDLMSILKRKMLEASERGDGDVTLHVGAALRSIVEELRSECIPVVVGEDVKLTISLRWSVP